MSVYEKQQVISIENIILICDGDIYNYKELSHSINIELKTNYSYEIIIHLFILYGIEQTLNLIDGIFSFILYDYRSSSQKVNSDIYIARDNYGVKNFLLLKTTNEYSKEQIYGFSSNIDILINFSSEDYIIENIKPGSYSVFNLPMKVSSKWKQISTNFYYNLPCVKIYNSLKIYNHTSITYELMSILIKSLDSKKKYNNTNKDLKFAYLLTNNISSFFMASFIKKNLHNTIEIYTIEIQNNTKSTNDKIKINKFCKKHNINTHTIKIDNEYDDTNTSLYFFGEILKNKYNGLISEIGMTELFGLNLCPTLFNHDIFEYDKNIRENIKNISLSQYFINTRNIGEINNFNIIYPFLDKDFINFYIYNHILIKKKNNGLIPSNFENYI